ncbi:AI-2E family transporter [Crocosphaera sp. UHCC 0190]|uniref:AI-2E family transporter n=1 Tax=Crocosphaera sp. UHCC 0190 TaxID=3110246 RepID=UPI002B1F27A2|nr:AI-2E family transporter [Crocosphaera sp. UHCC 0190]MEA5508299.1 AI-2E family transporter [Crocosphaera sp. UHCC 0190]
MFESWHKLPHWLRLSISFPLLFLNGWLLVILISYLEPLGTILTTATLLAFLVDFPIRLLEKRGVRRGLATAFVLFMVLIIIGLISFIFIPIIIEQLSQLLKSFPQWLESGNQQLESMKQWAIAKRVPIDFQEIIGQLAERLSNLIKSLGDQVLGFVGGTIGTVINLLFIFVLTVFLVLMGEQVWAGLFSWLPQPWDLQIRDSLRTTFEKYFATQAILAGIVSVAQTIVFLILQVPYALLFGFAIGIATLIPYTSGFVILLISCLLMFQDLKLGLTALILTLIVGQINDNILSPKLMGGMTGLNPVWIIISLFIGGRFAGILGLLVAVPLASVIKTTIETLRYPPDVYEEENISKLGQ